MTPGLLQPATRSRTAGADMPTRRASSAVLRPGVVGEQARI